MTNPLRLLYSSNSFWCTSGYGVQGRSLLPRLAMLPQFGGRQNIAQFAWYGLEGGMHKVDDFVIYPKFDDPYGNDVIGAHMRDFGANWLVSLIDVWVMQNTANVVAPALWTPWLPIDMDPVPDMVLRSLAGAFLPITYAKWGQELLAKAGVNNVYIPHGIEVEVYKVVSNRDHVRQFKQALTEMEHSHLTVIVAANKGQAPSRKFFEGQFEAWRDFRKDKPEARLYVHSDPTQVHGGVDFQSLVRDLGLENLVIIPDRYRYRLGFPPEYLSMVYNAADVLMSNSMSEGFGIPIIEAQACGAPVVVTNFSAMPELVRWGYAVEPLDMFRTAMNSYQAWPDKKGITERLNQLYDAWLICGGDWPISKRLQTSKAIHDEFDWDIVVRDYWAPLAEHMAEHVPALDQRFQVAVPEVPPNPAADFAAQLQQATAKPSNGVAEMVGLLNEAMTATPPRKRIAPLVVAPEPVASAPIALVDSNEEAQDKAGLEDWSYVDHL